MKNFGISDNSCMFAMFYAKGTKTNEKNGHFYVLLTTLIYKIRLFKSHVSRFFSKLTGSFGEDERRTVFLIF